MKALVYHGPRNVQIDDKPRPSIQHRQDAILRVTSTAICDSDLRLMKLDEAPKGYENIR
jgi:threonine dehydrogenase-like Zn-dependent dehydrogenase